MKKDLRNNRNVLNFNGFKVFLQITVYLIHANLLTFCRKSVLCFFGDSCTRTSSVVGGPLANR